MKEYITLSNPETGQVYRARLCKSFSERLIGYMFQKEPKESALLFPNCNSIHMFFMRFLIDAVFLDSHYQVIRNINNLRPGKIVLPVKDAVMVLEAPSNSLVGLNKGMTLILKKNPL